MQRTSEGELAMTNQSYYDRPLHELIKSKTELGQWAAHLLLHVFNFSLCVLFRFVVVVVSFSWFLLREWKTRIIVMKQEKINDHISKGDPPLRKNVDVEKKISCHNIRAIDSRFDWRQKFDRKWAATEVNCFDAFSVSLLELDKHKGHHFALSAVRIICTDVSIHCRCLFLFLTWQKNKTKTRTRTRASF